MRSDKLRRHEYLVQLIDDLIKCDDPATSVDFEGHKWAALYQKVWCEFLGCSSRTIRDLAKLPPIVSTRTLKDSSPITLYRLGNEPHKSIRHIASSMSSYFRSKTGKAQISKRDYGCLCGLIEVWPDGHQLELFKTAVFDWSTFISGVHWCASDEDEEKYKGRFYKFPSIPVIRRYPLVAVEMHIMDIQKKGGEVPKALIYAQEALSSDGAG